MSLRGSSRSALFIITFEPFRDWKFTDIVLTEANDRGFETVVAMDDRSTIQDRIRLREFADTVVPFPGGMTENGFRVLRHVKSDFALMLADDEQPSEPLWEFAAHPPSPNRFGIPVLPILGDKIYQDHVGLQERLVWLDGYKGPTTFEGDSEGAPKAVIDPNPGAVIWHYLLDAPRDEREEKARRYAKHDPKSDHRSRLIWEEHTEALVPIPKHLRKYLPGGIHA